MIKKALLFLPLLFMGCIEPETTNPNDSIKEIGHTQFFYLYKAEIDGRQYIISSEGGIVEHVPD